jgi:excisionase family DNA binding protein
MSIDKISIDDLTPPEAQQLHEGLRILARIIARAYKKELASSAVQATPQKLNFNAMPELLDTSNGKLTLSPGEVAKALGVSPTTVYEAVHQGQIPVIKWGKKILIPKVALAKMLAEAKPQIG